MDDTPVTVQVYLEDSLPDWPPNTFLVEYSGTGALKATTQEIKAALLSQRLVTHNEIYCSFSLERAGQVYIGMHEDFDPKFLDGEVVDITPDLRATITLISGRQNTRFRLLGVDPRLTEQQIIDIIKKAVPGKDFSLEDRRPTTYDTVVGKIKASEEEIPHHIEMVLPGGKRHRMRLLVPGRLTVCHKCEADTHFPSRCRAGRNRDTAAIQEHGNTIYERKRKERLEALMIQRAEDEERRQAEKAAEEAAATAKAKAEAEAAEKAKAEAAEKEKEATARKKAEAAKKAKAEENRMKREAEAAEKAKIEAARTKAAEEKAKAEAAEKEKAEAKRAAKDRTPPSPSTDLDPQGEARNKKKKSRLDKKQKMKEILESKKWEEVVNEITKILYRDFKPEEHSKQKDFIDEVESLREHMNADFHHHLRFEVSEYGDWVTVIQFPLVLEEFALGAKGRKEKYGSENIIMRVSRFRCEMDPSEKLALKFLD